MPSPSQPTPTEQLNARIDDLQRQANDLQREVLLASVKDEVENLDTLVGQLAARLQEARAAGYVFGQDLEPKAAALKTQWPGLRANAQRQLAEHAPRLQTALRPVEAQLADLNKKRNNVTLGRPLADQVAAGLTALDSKVTAARDAVRGGFDSFKGEAEGLRGRLDQIKRMLGWLAEAKFKLLATEGLYAAVEAKWDRDGKDDPKGLLYLTDQRLVFEQKEDVATKKLLFITTEKQKVHQLLLDLPVAVVDEVRASKKGLLGHEDHLDLALSAEAPVRAAHFHLDGQDSQLWEQWISRAKAKDLDKERAVKVDQAVIDKVASAPTQCPSCGGAFTKPVLRGQTEITCEFCGKVTRF